MKQAVAAVIPRRDRFLWVRRGPGVEYSGYWAPPSGSLEAGETQAQAVVREMMEELAIEVRPRRRVWECPSADNQYTIHWWLAELTNGEPRPDGREVSEVRWLTIEDIEAIEPSFEADVEFFLRIWPGLPES